MPSDLKPIYEALGSQLNVSVEGALQVDTVCQCWIRLHWGQYTPITIPEDLEDLERLVSTFYSVPPMSHCWDKSPYGKVVYDDQFVKFIDNFCTRTYCFIYVPEINAAQRGA